MTPERQKIRDWIDKQKPILDAEERERQIKFLALKDEIYSRHEERMGPSKKKEKKSPKSDHWEDGYRWHLNTPATPIVRRHRKQPKKYPRCATCGTCIVDNQCLMCKEIPAECIVTPHISE